MKKMLENAAAGILALLGVLIVAPPAMADTTNSGLKDGDYCWTALDTGYTACFVSDQARTSAIEKASGNALEVSSPRAVTSPMISRSPFVNNRSGAVPLDTQYLLLTVYINSNYGGSSHAFTTGLSSACYGYSFTVNSLGFSWNDVVSSYSPNSSNGCRVVKVFKDVNLQGDWMQTTGDVSYVGDSFNDQISSLWISG